MKRVALGMSGGIDSTISALLLLEQGFEVTGITMSIWDERIPIPESVKSGCFGPGEKEDLEAAREACAKLGIEHRVIPLQAEFAANVLDYFCATYQEGKTPNPCVRCNQHLKFGLLPRRAREAGIEFDFFATGHYVRKSYSPELQRWQLLQATDPLKDQSYFLCFLSQEQLAGSLFPLGDKTKQDIRRLAQEQGFDYLVTKKESQDFLETDDYSVLFPQGAFQPGDIIDSSGRLLGKHRGLIHYTIGQRRGLGLSGMPEPWYVVNIEAERNRIVVGPKELLYKDRLLAKQINWVSIPGLDNELAASAKIRLGHTAASCRIKPVDDSSVEVLFQTPQLSITPGQAVVFYAGEVLLGGGIIS